MKKSTTLLSVALLALFMLPMMLSPDVALGRSDPGAEEPGSIAGIVFSTEPSGYEPAPVPGAIVYLWSENGAIDRTQTDREGAYIFERLDAGVFKLQARKAGYRPSELVEVALESGQNLEDVYLFLRPVTPQFGTITGSVFTPTTDPTSPSLLEPVAGAIVFCYGENSTDAWKRRTDEHGFYGFRLPAGVYTLLVVKDGFEPSEVIRVELEAGEFVEGIDFVIYPTEGASISGMVYTTDPNDPTGIRIPLANAIVYLATEDGVMKRTRTADDGTYIFENLEAGAYSLHARKRGYYPSLGVSVLLEEGQALEDLDFLLLPRDDIAP